MSELQAYQVGKMAVAKKREEIATVKAAINTKEKIIAERAIPINEDLYKKRRDILAAIAVGTAGPDDLVPINDEIAKHEAAKRAAEPVVDEARQTVEGLRDNLKDAERELAAAVNEARLRFAELVWAEAVRADEERVKAFKVGDAMIRRLVGLNEMLSSMTGKRDPIGVLPLSNYSIPAFQLPPSQGEPKCGPHGGCLAHGPSFHSGNSDLSFRPSTLEAAERGRMRGLGVDFED